MRALWRLIKRKTPKEQSLRTAFSTFQEELTQAGVDAIAFIVIVPNPDILVLSTEVFTPISKDEASVRTTHAVSVAHAKFSKELIGLGIQTGHSFVNTERFSVKELEPLRRAEWKKISRAKIHFIDLRK